MRVFKTPLIFLIFCTFCLVVNVSGAESLSKVGAEVVLQGVAQNSKTGAVLVTREKLVHMSKLASWPNGLVGSRIEVVGYISHEQYFPLTRRSKSGEISQGLSEKQWVMRNPTWRVLYEAKEQ